MKVSPQPLAALAAILKELIEPLVDERVAKVLAVKEAGSELLSTSEAAGYARVAPGTIRRWVREGKLTPSRAGRELRISRRELTLLLKGGWRKQPGIDLSPEEMACRDFAG